MTTCACQASPTGLVEPTTYSAPDRPPKAWFEKPTDLKPGERRWYESGRAAGYVAKWGTCLLTPYAECFTPPKSPTDYALAHQGSCLTAEGEMIAVANIGGRVNHADIYAPLTAALDHYANIATRTMRVRYGEDDYGIWYAGALEPDLPPAEVASVRSSAVSGDWRYRPQLRAYDMAGVQLVNTPGFPMAEHHATYVSIVEEMEMMSFAASAAVVSTDLMPERVVAVPPVFAAAPALTAAPASIGNNGGVMVAVPIPERIAEAAGIQEDPPHLTLAYLGRANEVDRDKLARAMADFRFLPLAGSVGGIGAFPDQGDGMPVWMPADIHGLNELAQRVREHLAFYGLSVRQDHAFVPHITVKWAKEGEALPPPVEIMPIEVSSILVAHGADRWEVESQPSSFDEDAHGMTAAVASTGAWVKWGTFGRVTRGKIIGVKTNGSYTVAGSSVIVNAKPGNPAVLIQLYKRENRNSNKFIPTDKKTAKLSSTLERWAGPGSANPTDEKGGTSREEREAKQNAAQGSLAGITARIAALTARIS